MWGTPYSPEMQKATATVAFVCLVLWLEVDLYFQSSKLDGVIWQVFAGWSRFGVTGVTDAICLTPTRRRRGRSA
jgi:hypothetical protein